MDDVVQSCDDFHQGLEDLRKLLTLARQHGLLFSPKKTKLFVSETPLGGQIVGAKGVSPDPAKVLAIVNWPRPTTALQLLSFVSTCGFFRSMIKDFSSIAAPLSDLYRVTDRSNTTKGSYKKALTTLSLTDKWQPIHDEAMKKLKTALATFPVIRDPQYTTPPTPFHIVVDASGTGFGAELYQEVGGVHKTIMFASKKTSPAESRRHSYVLELTALKWSLDKFDEYIHGQPIIIYTDCTAMKAILNKPSVSGIQARWKEAINSRNILQLIHKPGKENVVADGLSRNATDGDTTEVTDDPLQHKLLLLGCRRMSPDENLVLRTAFRGDTLAAVVDYLTGFFPSDEDGVAKRAAGFWIDDTKLWTRSKGTGRPVQVLPAKEGIIKATNEHNHTHFGRDLCLRALTSKYMWPNMRKHIEEIILRCEHCLQFGAKMQRFLLRSVSRFKVFDTIALDYLSMPRADTGELVILVAIDVYSKFIWAWPFKTQGSAETTIAALEDLRQRYTLPKYNLHGQWVAFRQPPRRRVP